MPPQRIQRFEIADALGSGGMGTVYRAWDPHLQRDVAIKVMANATDVPATLSPDETVDLRGGDARGADDMLREARMMARLSHPNVTPVYEVGLVDGALFVVMEHIAGCDLERYIAKPRSTAQILHVLAQAARGLAAAHACGVIHRDFKPANVLVGNDGRVRVADFGLSRMATSSALVRVNDAHGTPRYMAPELWRGEQASIASDVYAFCMSAAVVLGDVDPELREQRWRELGLSPRLRQLLSAGLSDTPALRPRLDDIIAALEGRGRPLRRRVVWIAAATAALVLAGAGTAAVVVHRNDRRAAIFAASHLPAVQPTPLPGDPLQITVHRLSNGLTVYISPNHDMPRIRALWRFRVGDAAAPGIAHLALLMSRRGTETFGTIDYAAEKPLLDGIRALYVQRAKTTDPKARAWLDSMIDVHSTLASAYEVPDEHGRVTQALGLRAYDTYTFRDQAYNEVDIASNRFDAWVALEADRWQHPVFRLFRSQVAEAIGWMDLRDGDFSSRVLDSTIPKLFEGHPLGYAPDAWRHGLIPEPYLETERYFRTYFVPNNADLILAGDIDPVTAIPLLERAFAGWKPRALPPLPLRPAAQVKRTETLKVPTAGNSELSFHYAIPPQLERDPGLLVMDGVIKLLAQETGHSLTRSRFYFGAYSVSVTPTPGESLDDASRALDAVLAHVRAGEFSDDLLSAIRGQLAVNVWRASTTNAGRVRYILVSQEPGRSQSRREQLDAEARYARVTREDVSRLARAILIPVRLTVRAEPGPIKKPQLVLPKAPATVFPAQRSKAALALTEREVVPVQPKFLVAGRDYEERDGGHVIVARDPKSKYFRVTLRYDVGSAEIPFLCAAASARGLDTDIVTRWNRGAYSTDADCSSHSLQVEVTGLDSELPQAITLMFDALRPPTATAWAKMLQVNEQKFATMFGRTTWIDGFLDRYAVFGVGVPELDLYDFARAKAAPPDAAERALATLRRSERWIGYYGPRSLDEVVKLLPPQELGRGATHMSSRGVGGGPRVIIVDAASLANVTHVSIVFGLDEMLGQREAVLGAYGQYWSFDSHPIIDALRGIANFSFVATYPKVPRYPGSLAFRLTTSPRQVPLAIDKALAAILDQPVDAALLERAKREEDEKNRANWISRLTIPATVIQWHVTGHAEDPRPTIFARVAMLAVPDVAALNAHLRKSTRVITIWGSVDGIDRKALARYGEITEVPLAKLFKHAMGE